MALSKLFHIPQQSNLLDINPAQYKRIALYGDPAEISLSYPSPPVLIA